MGGMWRWEVLSPEGERGEGEDTETWEGTRGAGGGLGRGDPETR